MQIITKLMFAYLSIEVTYCFPNKANVSFDNWKKNDFIISSWKSSYVPHVKVDEGILEGQIINSVWGNDYYSFKGIPYAEPPIGVLRFKDPQPKKHWNGVHVAIKEGNVCPQVDLKNIKYKGNEDCLYLNIFTPYLKNDHATPLPVMFYIHGGGFFSGSGSSDDFGPDFLVNSGVILVTTNYRLGVYGFLSLSTSQVPGNAGLKDQNLALKWVKRNIKHFNGDPDNITIFGLSAGGVSVEYHLISPMSKGLFNKAIIQSGSTLNSWVKTKDIDLMTNQLTKWLNINETDSFKIMKRLQKIDAQHLLKQSVSMIEKQQKTKGRLYGASFVPVVEKKIPGVEPFLDREPFDILKNGDFQRVPVISGFSANEGYIFKTYMGLNISKDLTKGKLINYIPSDFKIDKGYFNEILCNAYNKTDPINSVENFLSDLAIVGGVTQSTMMRSRFTKSNYFYRFNYNGNINYMKRLQNVTHNTVLHTDETCYLAPVNIVTEADATVKDQITRCRMVKMWTDFAKTGKPTSLLGSCVDTNWLPVTSSYLNMLEISDSLKMIKEFPHPERHKLWQALYENYHP